MLRNYDNIDISSPDYIKDLNDKDFENLSIEQQNMILRETVIALSSDFEKLVLIIMRLQNNLNNTIEWIDNDLMKILSEVDCINAELQNHMDTVHTHLIIGKEKQ